MILKFDILNHADFHGHFREDEDTPGLSRFAKAIQRVRDLNPDGTLLLDAGDNTNKVLWPAEQVFEGLHLLGTDAHTLGNHEFDKGQAVLEHNIAYASQFFPIVCSNAYLKGTDVRVPGTVPCVILERMGVKFGIVGCTTEYTPKMVEMTAFAPYEVRSAVHEIRKYVPIMKQEGADIIVVLSHFPFYFENGEGGELFDVLHQVEDLPIDVMIGGHIPGDYAKVYHDIAVSKGGFGGCSLPHITLHFDTETRKVVKKEGRVINVLKELERIDEIQAFQEKVIEPFRDFYEKPIGYAVDTLPMRLAYESPMGNFIADAIRDKAQTDIGYFNATSCGRKIEKGELTRFSIHKAIAFNETIHLTKMKGQLIYDLFECVLEPHRFGNNANIIFSGIRVEIDNTKEINKVLSICLNDGTPLDKEKEYTVCSSKYMSSGGNDTRSIASQVEWVDNGYRIHDAIADYITKLQKIESKMDHRYKMIGEVVNDNSPW